MPDWQELVRRRLPGLALEATERDEVHSELAAHLEESYEAFCKKGLPEKEAVDRTMEQVSDWRDLQSKILIARGGHLMRKRAQQLWIPGLLTLILSMVFLTIFYRLGFRVRVVGSSGEVFFFVPWLASLPFLGALGAYVSSRAGGSRGTAVLAGCFPVVALTMAFLLMFPIGMIIEWVRGSQGDFSNVGATLLQNGFGWLLLPGVALLAGALLVNLFFGQHAAHGNAPIG